MDDRILDFLTRYISAYGYYIVFLALLFENLFITGLVIPGETVLLAAAAFAGAGTLNITYIILTAIVAATIGNVAGYFIGEHGGRPLIEKYGGRFFSEERIKAAEEYFDQQGTKTVFLGRFAAGIRVFIPLLAGASKMNFLKFLAYTVAAVVLWSVGIGLLGYFFGQNWPLIRSLVGRFGIFVLVLIIGFISYYILRRRLQGGHNRGKNRR